MSHTDMSTPFAPPIRLGLLLIPGFALMGYATLVEAFRAANTLSGRTLYTWSHVSAQGAAVEASCGARILADAQVGARIDCATLFVFAGGDPRNFHDPATYGWLRALARGGCAIAGISGGPYVMARAGLLAGRRATIHWEHRPLLAEHFPDVAIESGLYVIDGAVITCAGGTAGLDLALALIARDHGHALAARVGEWFIRTTPRDAAGPQRQSPAERHGTTNRVVLQALATIEAGLDRPLPRTQIAAACGRSLRQIERLFQAELGQSLAQTMLTLRLDSAAHRLRTTDASVTQIALDCGFASAAHFSRRVRQRFGVPPSGLRKAVGQAV
ncbi:GlxA family transcriptional regulator [Novosphingobium sp.]|uniref:GlxA family transcriptional regulator n=1 Tax=Novosphingobium sp. TaxID=1874826 RepID=UPI003341ECD4